ncbi:hypothetical protein WICPIJ_002392 [Wickerhamomyces pijperi]|uniref:Uncharacterized protein n=1 Tax=Wickerhamomyces pijperi TaxID=599730 RepID=A0A9P8Q935_WICPI|nr:hypothetical protein WICPIJ_002392 [Wickerhamomyces pijperi]
MDLANSPTRTSSLVAFSLISVFDTALEANFVPKLTEFQVLEAFSTNLSLILDSVTNGEATTSGMLGMAIAEDNVLVNENDGMMNSGVRSLYSVSTSGSIRYATGSQGWKIL